MPGCRPRTPRRTGTTPAGSLSIMSISMHFCHECSNMMVPREKKSERKLVYVCHRCGFEQDAISPITYRLEIIKSAVNQLEKVPTEVVTDPALTRPEGLICTRCGAGGGVMIQAKPTPSDNKIKLMFVCSNEDCKHKWQQ